MTDADLRTTAHASHALSAALLALTVGAHLHSAAALIVGAVLAGVGAALLLPTVEDHS